MHNYTLGVIFPHGGNEGLQNTNHLSPEVVECTAHHRLSQAGIGGHRGQAVVSLQSGMIESGVTMTLCGVDLVIPVHTDTKNKILDSQMKTLIYDPSNENSVMSEEQI